MVYLSMGWIVVVVLLIIPFAPRAEAPVYYHTEATSAGPLQHSLRWTSGFV